MGGYPIAIQSLSSYQREERNSLRIISITIMTGRRPGLCAEALFL